MDLKRMLKKKSLQESNNELWRIVNNMEKVINDQREQIQFLNQKENISNRMILILMDRLGGSVVISDDEFVKVNGIIKAEKQKPTTEDSDEPEVTKFFIAPIEESETTQNNTKN